MRKAYHRRCPSSLPQPSWESAPLQPSQHSGAYMAVAVAATFLATFLANVAKQPFRRRQATRMAEVWRITWSCRATLRHDGNQQQTWPHPKALYTSYTKQTCSSFHWRPHPISKIAQAATSSRPPTQACPTRQAARSHTATTCKPATRSVCLCNGCGCVCL